MQLNMKPQPIAVAKILTGIALVIALVSLISEYLVEVVLIAQQDTLIVYILDLFSVNLEDSIPTWYSVLILFSASILLALIAWGKQREEDTFARHWLGLSVIFLYLSMDEGAVIHEIVADPLQIAFNTSGFLTFGWQIIAIPLVILFGLLYLRFVLHLPTKTRNLFILAAACYAGGALIIEGISANQWALDDGNLSMTYLSIATFEEFLEIWGVSLFIYALLDYMLLTGYIWTIGDDQSVISEHPKRSLSAEESLRFNPLMLIITLLLITNLVSIGWILQNHGTVILTQPVPFYQAIQSDLDQANVLVVEAQTLFTPNNQAALQLAHALLDVYQEISVIVLPNQDKTIIFAGDNIPFDRDTITDLLHANGQIEFIIYETDVVRVFTATLSP
ncbi:MAG: hypothetical protein WBC91_11405 [Phototrophicaceae bacterium]